MGLSFIREAEHSGTGLEGDSPVLEAGSSDPAGTLGAPGGQGRGSFPGSTLWCHLSLWVWSQATPRNMLPLRGSEEVEGDPLPLGPLIFPVTQYGVSLAHLSPRLREESFWHLREGEVCGQPWDFLVTIPRPPPRGPDCSGCWEVAPGRGAHMHQREGPSCLSDLAFSQSSTDARNCHLQPPFSWDSQGLSFSVISQAPQVLEVGMDLRKRRS